METIITFIVPLIFTNNLVLSLVKYASDYSFNKVWLRVILGFVSIAGVIAGSAITGDPVDFDSITSLLNLTIDAAVVAFGSHYAYKTIKI